MIQFDNLYGEIELPLALGTIGGMTNTHPLAQIALKILRVENASELSQVAAAVGLAQNVAALRALVSEGIQKGHMALHARNVAATAGARGEQVDIIAEKLVKEKNVKVERAKEILEELAK